ncbi:MAG: hypothetical protein ABS939_13710 [Psychrobacillus sp.]
MNKYQIDCARNIKTIAKTLSSDTVIEKEKIEMIIKLANEIIEVNR